MASQEVGYFGVAGLCRTGGLSRNTLTLLTAWLRRLAVRADCRNTLTLLTA